MIHLEQPKNTPESTMMAVEIEVLPLDSPSHRYDRLRVRYLVDNRLVLELESSINPYLAEEPLTWLKKAINTRRKYLSTTIGELVSDQHLICVEQTRLSKEDFSEIQAELGAEAFPHPFLYAIDVLVNPDPEGLVHAGIGMRFNGLSYAEIAQFLFQIRDEVNTAYGISSDNNAAVHS